MQTERNQCIHRQQRKFRVNENPINTRLQHVNMRYHSIRQAVKGGSIKVAFMGTKSMIADIFTKNFTVAEFERLRSLALGYGEKPDLPDDLKKRLRLDG